MKDHWKTFREVCGITYQLVDTRDSVQVCASIKVDISSKVQLGEDIKRAIADSKTRPIKPQRDPLPYVMCAASIACQAFGLFDDNPALSNPTMKIYAYIYVVLSLVFQELTI